MPKSDLADARAVLLDVFDHAFNKRSWHGANLTSAIRGVDATTAARRVRGRRNIWEQVLHAAYWKQAAMNKLTGTLARLPRRGSNWLMPKDITEAAWRADVALLHDVHRRLRAAIATIPVQALDQKKRWLIHGIAAHDLYHAGQIKLLRRLVK